MVFTKITLYCTNVEPIAIAKQVFLFKELLGKNLGFFLVLLRQQTNVNPDNNLLLR
jgi:hypothetical protein